MYFNKGEGALKWDANLVRSARVNWSFIAANLLIGPIAILFSMVFSIWVTKMGFPTLPLSLWARVPVAVQVIFAIILIDFIEYWEHRFKHKTFLWPLHAVHHSDTSLNYTSWQRLHPLDSFLHHIFFVLLGTFLGLSYVSIGWLVLARALHQQYVHMNLDWTHGPLEKFIASPRFHRWHHADTPEAYDKNFALFIPLWDHMFGTFYNPGSCKTATGFDENPGDNFLKLIAFPFVAWGKMIARSFTNKAAQPDV